jgi:hypothetical protein
MGEFEDMWLVFSRIMDPGDFSPRIKFYWLLRNEPTDVRRADDINQLEKEAVKVSIPKWAAESDINLGGYSFSLEALHACARQYNTVSDLFMKEIWPGVMEDLKMTRALKREQITRDHIYCIIDQGSGDMSMDKPKLMYLGEDFRVMWQKVKEYVSDFKDKCFRKSTNKYIRPDKDDVYDTWEDLMDSLFDTLVEDNEIIISDQVWDDDADPGFFCVYAKKQGDK